MTRGRNLCQRCLLTLPEVSRRAPALHPSQACEPHSHPPPWVPPQDPPDKG